MNNSKNKREKLETIVLSGKDGVEEHVYAQSYSNSSMQDIKAIPVIQEHAKDQNSGIVLTEINNTTVNSIVTLADLIIRQLTRAKYGSSIKSLSKDSMLEGQIEVNAKFLKMALKKFGADQPKTYLTNVSIERVGARIGKGN